MDDSIPNTAICPDCQAPYNSQTHHRQCENPTPEECKLIHAMKQRKQLYCAECQCIVTGPEHYPDHLLIEYWDANSGPVN